MQYKGAVFFDYDGTLADENAGIHMPTQATKQAVRRLRENGYLAILATGRAMPYMNDGGIKFDGIITSNGAYALAGGEVVLDHPIAVESMMRLIQRMNEIGVCYSIDHPEKCLTNDVRSEDFQIWIHTFDIPEASFRNIEPGEAVVGYKLCILFHKYEEIAVLCEEFPEFEFFPQRVFKYADVNIRGFNKAFGVKAICRHFGLRQEETYAFGDSTNDIKMLECVGHGIAMGNHAPELAPYAEFITRSVADEGIEWGMKHYGLI